jgi:serine protease Do
LRGGKEQQVPVKLGDFKDASGPASTPAKADPAPKPAATTDLEALGLKLSVGKGRDGVTIAEVDSNSDAALKGLRAGDTIVEVSSQPVATVEDVSKGLAEASKLGRRALLLRIRSGDQTRFVAVQLKKG